MKFLDGFQTLHIFDIMFLCPIFVIIMEFVEIYGKTIRRKQCKNA